ncbi:hypothetical protein [Streptomyces noursei]|uniref:hypothetical protein n=1 Tax=Streptomyces noursei TaxID=1971 RepID=UPI0016797F35|nr:hypothetical protein [Streptomyces noursei]MCZ1017710.1 hypothetical protein [Streptomyces noursei]GGX16399.1 hypothetical protein GCM10010341_42380 [Streptomyces noursei]
MTRQDPANTAQSAPVSVLGIGAMLVPPTLLGRPEATILCSGSQRAHTDHKDTLRALAGRARPTSVPTPGRPRPTKWRC